MKNNCSNCEAENEINSKYCSICGFKLSVKENDNQIDKVESNKTTTKTKNKINLKRSLSFIIGFFFVFFLMQFLFKPSINKQLIGVANELNKNCPMIVDEYTTIKNVVALPNNTLQYNYILTGVTKDEVKIDTLKKYVFPGILANMKTSPQMKSFRNNKVTLNYYYTDKDGVYVTRYIVKPDMYE